MSALPDTADLRTALRTASAEHWWAVVLFVLTTAFLTRSFAVAYEFAFSWAAITTSDPFFLARPSLNGDSALFQHGGWYMTQGATLYVDIWDIKPPLIYFLTAALALVSDGNMTLLHFLSGLVSALAIVGSVVLVGALVHEVTNDGVAALAGGVSVFALPYLYTYPIHGVRPKYFVCLFGLAGLWLALRDRPATAGALAAIAAGFWQFGAVFVLLVIGMAASQQRRAAAKRPAYRALAGAAVVTALTVAPFVLWGAFVPMVVEVVIAPFYSQGAGLLANTYALVRALGYAIVLLPVAAYGWARLARPASADSLPGRGQCWLVVGGALVGVQVLFLDMDSWADLPPAMMVVAVGVGVAVAAHPRTSRRRWALVAVVVVAVVAAPVWMGPTAPLKDDFEQVTQENPPEWTPNPDIGPDTPRVQTIYWQQRTPEECAYRGAPAAAFWVAQTPAEFGDGECGAWP